jgi:hypothetical protein
MPAYRAYVLGSQGQILGRSDFKCDDDAAALEYARKNVLNRSIEVWQGDRLVGTVHPGNQP